MGDYRIEINAQGGHGCQRELGNGCVVEGCGRPGCPDCLVRKFVADLKAHGNTVKDALLIHWPYGPGTVLDNLLTKERSGSFRG